MVYDLWFFFLFEKYCYMAGKYSMIGMQLSHVWTTAHLPGDKSSARHEYHGTKEQWRRPEHDEHARARRTLESLD